MNTQTTVRTPRAKREIIDTVEVLYAKVLEQVAKFRKESDKIRARKSGQSIIYLASGDTQPNRRAMLFLLKEARKWVTYEVAQAAKKVQALAEDEALVAPVVDGWKAANEAWTMYVQAEKAKGHNGQKAIAGEFWSDFAHFEPLVLKPRGTKEAVAELVAKLEDLTFRAGNFVHAKWCACGAPLYEIIPHDGDKKPFMPKLCGTCFRSEPDESVKEAKSAAKRHVKKPGSAKARHKGGAKKAKGELSPKDKAKNAKLLTEAFEKKATRRKGGKK